MVSESKSNKEKEEEMRRKREIKMRRTIICILTILFSILPLLTAFAQDLIIYPAKGQSQEQMEKDKYECYSWAKGQTGFDPMAPQQTVQSPQPQSQAPQGERIRGGSARCVDRSSGG